MRAVHALVILVAVAGCLRAPAPPSDVAVELELVADGFDSPVYVIVPPDGSKRLFVVEQGGTIRVADGAKAAAQPFLDLRSRVEGGGEQGLLSIAFEPGYAETRRFYVSYTDNAGDSVLARYEAEPQDPDRTDPATATTILTQDQPFPNHNGGLALFGPDGMLYVGLGDGGGAGDPFGNAQDPGTWLGKLLRIDVVGEATYAVPGDNPKRDGWRPEIWALGLRNPWRFSFDPQTKDLWIGDVGQNSWEEVDFAPASSRGGENYGWNVYEGSHRYRAGSVDDAVAPVHEYSLQGSNCAITGGHVYRGEAIPGLQGSYVFADYCGGTIWALEGGSRNARVTTLLQTSLSVSSFGLDADGEMLVVDHGGAIHRLRPA